jgi:hypothetical protein
MTDHFDFMPPGKPIGGLTVDLVELETIEQVVSALLGGADVVYVPEGHTDVPPFELTHCRVGVSEDSIYTTWSHKGGAQW